MIRYGLKTATRRTQRKLMKINVKKNQRTLDGFDSYTVIFSVGNPKDVKNVALKISQRTLFSLLFWVANYRLPRMPSTGPAP